MNHSFLMGGQSIHVNMIHHLFGYKFCLKVLYHGILAWDGIFSMLCYIFCMKTSYLMCISNTIEHMARSAPSCVWRTCLAEPSCKHGPHVEEESSQKYLGKSSKAMAGLWKIVLDPKWLKHLHFYVQFWRVW